MVRKSRGRSRGRGATRALRSLVHAEFSGVTPRGRNDPPRIVASPWNSVTLVGRGATTGEMQSFMASSLRTLLISQVGLTGLTAKVDFRFIRVDIWLDPLSTTTGGAGTSNLGLLPTSFQGSSFSARNWIEDIGTPVSHAHCHYIWPKLDSNSIITSDYGNAVFRIDTKIKDLGYTMHVHLLWRSHVGDLVPSFRLCENFEHLNL